jgi:type IV pilus assembly protein PilE
VNRERGFTLIELMIVVAVIAILAAIVIPAWTKEAQSSKADSEVNAMMTEIAAKLEQYKSEIGNGSYYNGASPNNITTPLGPCPATETPSGSDWNASCGSAAGWTTLHVAAPESTMRCTYKITMGDAGTVPSPPSGFTMTTPSGAWWYVVATCDMDNNSGNTSATFFRSSNDSKLQKQNYGQ